VGTPPAKYSQWIEAVVLIERLREVQALAGFSRLEPAGDDSTAKLVALRRGPAEWVPAAEVRGEGLFLRLSEEKVSKGCGSHSGQIFENLIQQAVEMLPKRGRGDAQNGD